MTLLTIAINCYNRLGAWVNAAAAAGHHAENAVTAITAAAAGGMSGRPGRERHTAGRSGVNRDSRMPLPKNVPSDRRRHSSLRAEAREYHGILYNIIVFVIDAIQRPPSAAEFGKGWSCNCS